MAIKPKEILKLKDEEIGQLKRLEEKIDRILTEKFDGFPVRVSVIEINRLRDPAKKELFSRYEKAGWSVKYGYFDDQREPHLFDEWYEFEPESRGDKK